MRASVWALSTTFLSAKSTRAASCSSRGALQMVCTEGMRRMRVARRPAAELFGLGAKKKCRRSGALPSMRRPMTRALSFMPGAKPPALAGYTGSAPTASPSVWSSPRRVMTAGA